MGPQRTPKAIPVYKFNLESLELCPFKVEARPVKGFRTNSHHPSSRSSSAHFQKQAAVPSEAVPSVAGHSPVVSKAKDESKERISAAETNSSGSSGGGGIRQSLTYPSSWERSEPEKHYKEQKTFYEPVQLMRERQLICSERGIFVLPKAQKSADPKSKRPQANLHTVSVPKKGLIKLTGLAYEFENPQYFDDRKEIAEQRWYQAFQEETYGSPLPPPSCDAHRGHLIRNKSMIKQVKFGELRLRAEQEEEEIKSRATSATSNTSFKGLLQYEMPEVPNLNNNLKKFLGGKSNDDNERFSARHNSHQRQTSGSSNQRKETIRNAKLISRNRSNQEPCYDTITTQVHPSQSEQVNKHDGGTQHTNRLSFINLSYDNELKSTT